MESMMAYCSKFEDSVEAPASSFLSSTLNENFDFSVPTARYELFSNDDDDDDDDTADHEGIHALNRDLIKELEISRKKIKRLEADLTYHRQHMDTIEEEYNQMLKSLTESEVKNKKKDEKLEILEKTVCSLKCELESFYNTDTSANETNSSASDLHGALCSSSDSANNMQVNCKVENKVVEPKIENDKPEFEAFYKEFVPKYNEALEENIKLKEELSRLNKEIVDLKDIIFYRDQMASENCSDNSIPLPATPDLTLADELNGLNQDYHDQTALENCSDNSIPFPTTPGLTLADELSIENQEMPSVIIGAGSLDISYQDLIISTNSNVLLDAKNNENEKVPLDMTSIENQEMPSLIIGIGNQDISYQDLNISTNSNVLSEEKDKENEKVPLEMTSIENPESPSSSFGFSWFIKAKKVKHILLFVFIALIWKGFTQFEPAVKFESELKPYYTLQEITSDFFNQLALSF